MGRYIQWDEVVGRYPEVSKGKDATTVGSSYIPLAEAEVEGALGSRFTVPFSSNNATVVDMAIDLVYAKVYRFKDPKKAEKVDAYVQGRVKRLLAGSEVMVTKDGEAIDGSVAGTVFSTTQNYNPVFSMLPVEMQRVDSGQLADEEGALG